MCLLSALEMSKHCHARSCAAGPAPHHTHTHTHTRQAPRCGNRLCPVPRVENLMNFPPHSSSVCPPHSARQTIWGLVGTLVLAKPEGKCLIMGKTGQRPRHSQVSAGPTEPGLAWRSRHWGLRTQSPSSGVPWSWMASGFKGHMGTSPPHSHLGPVLGSKVSDEVTVRASFRS